MTVFFETPHEFIAIELAATVVIHSAEDNAETSDAIGTSGFKSGFNLVENLIRGFSGQAKDCIDVGVVSTAFVCKESCEFFII